MIVGMSLNVYTHEANENQKVNRTLCHPAQTLGLKVKDKLCIWFSPLAYECQSQTCHDDTQNKQKEEQKQLQKEPERNDQAQSKVKNENDKKMSEIKQQRQTRSKTAKPEREKKIKFNKLT